MRGKEAVFSSPKLKSKAQDELCFFKGTYMSDSKTDCENVELIKEIPGFEYMGPTLNDEDEEFEDELLLLALQQKVRASTLRRKIIVWIPFFRARIFSIYTRPFFWDGMIALRRSWNVHSAMASSTTRLNTVDD